MATVYHIAAAAPQGQAHSPTEILTVRKIGVSDIKDALAKGFDDFMAMPSFAIFLTIIYPIIGIVLGRMAMGYNSLPMLFPLMAGFPLVGAFAAVGLYELSRRREQGLDTSVGHVFDVFGSRNAVSIALLGGMLLVLFVAWLLVAQVVYDSTLGIANAVWRPDLSIEEFARQVFTTPEGWTMIVAGNVIGFLFALAAFSLSVVSFPLALDRNVGAMTAAAISLRAVAANPLPMAAWGVIVALLLALGTIPFFTGLIVVVPVLGHATWHLYRKLISE